MNVELTFAEVLNVAIGGVMRQTQNIKLKRKHAHGAEEEQGWQMHVEGALAEFAVAKALGQHWTVGEVRAADVGNGLSVRSTCRPNGCLLLHDTDTGPFVLAVGQNERWSLRGWLSAEVGRDVGTWRTDVRHPCYFVEQRLLRPVTELLEVQRKDNDDLG